MLSDNAFFSGVEAASLVRVLPAFRLATFARGALLYRRGGAARRVFLIVSGSVAVVQRSGSVRTTIAVLGPGEFTGEHALLEPPGRHRWSAVCCEETQVAVAEGDELLAALLPLPALGINVARGLHRRVHDAAHAIDALIASA
ncbi:MAG: cyclic nucleotide-binding domain-containing protein [Candidatus Lustribacter sp.]